MVEVGRFYCKIKSLSERLGTRLINHSTRRFPTLGGLASIPITPIDKMVGIGLGFDRIDESIDLSLYMTI